MSRFASASTSVSKSKALISTLAVVTVAGLAVLGLSIPAQAIAPVTTINYNPTIFEPDGVTPDDQVAVDLYDYSNADQQWEYVTTSYTGEIGQINPDSGDSDSSFTLNSGTEYAIDVQPQGTDAASGGWLVGTAETAVDPDFVQTGSTSAQTWFTAGTSDLTPSVTLPVGGSVSGSVTDVDGSPSATVGGAFALRLTTDIYGNTSYEQAGNFALGDGSTYTATQLPSGTYKFEADQTGNTSELTQAFNGGASTLDAATPVTFDASSTAPNEDLQFQAASFITGATTVDGTPTDMTSDLNVTAFPVDSQGDVINGDQTYTGTVSSDDSYSVSVPSGHYILDFNWTDQPSGDVYYNNTLDEGSAETVSVGAGATTSGIDATFASSTSITGKATSTDGTGISGLTVTAQGYDNPITTTTASDGSYSFSGLPVEPYSVEFSDPTGVLNDTYWNGSTFGSTGDPGYLEAASGPAQVANVEFQVPTTLTVNVANKAGTALKGVDVSAYPIENGAANFTDEISADAVPGKTGGYEFTGMSENQAYALYFDPSGSALTGTYAQYLGGSDIASQAQTFTPTQSTSTLSVTLASANSVTGTVTSASSGKTLAGVAVGLWEYDGSTWQQVNGTLTGSKGTYSFPNVATGSYTVQFVTEESEGTATTYLDSFAGGEVSHDGAVPVTADVTTAYVGAGKPAVFNGKLTLGGSLAGVVESSTGTKLAAQFVEAIGVNVNGSGVITGTNLDYGGFGFSSKTGSFSIPGLQTGYYVLSFADDSPYADPFTDPTGETAATASGVYHVTAGKATAISAAIKLQPQTAVDTADVTFAIDSSSVGPVTDFDPDSTVEITDLHGNYVTAALIDTDSNTFEVDLAPGTYDYVPNVINADNENEYFDSTPVQFTVVAGASTQTIHLALATPLAFAGGPITVDGSATPVGSSYSVSGAASNRTTDSDDIVTPTYQWYRGTHAIRGATEATYTSQGSDYGYALSVHVSLEDFTYGQEDVEQTVPVVSNVSLGAQITNVNGPSIDATAAKVNVALHVNAGLWSVPGATYSYAWTSTAPGGQPVSVGTDSPTYTPAISDIAATIAVSVTASQTGYASSDAVPASGNLIVVPMDAPTVTKAPVVTLKSGVYSVTAGTWSVSGTTPIYQWSEAGIPVPSSVNPLTTGTSASFTPSATTDSVTVTVGAVKNGYTPGSTTVVARKGTSIMVFPGDKPIVTDSVVGSVTDAEQSFDAAVPVGSTVSIPTFSANILEDETPVTTFTYQWYRQVGSSAPVAIKGATSKSYVVTTTDVGALLSVYVTGSNSTNSATPVQRFLGGVGALRQDLVVSPAAVSASPSNTNAASSKITDVVGSWGTYPAGGTTSSVTDTYQWSTVSDSEGDNPAAISKATSASYTPPATAAGTYIQLQVIGSKTGYASATVLGPVTQVGNVTPVATKKPAITTATTTYTVSAGTWPTGDTVDNTYQWYVNGVADTTDLYAATPIWQRSSADTGNEISVVVTHPAVGGYSAVTTTLIAQKGAAPSTDIESAGIVGTMSYGNTLSVSSTISDNFDFVGGTPSDAVQTYQWYSASSSTATPKSISGATKSTYAPTSSYIGKFLSVKITVTSAEYATQTRTFASSTAFAIGTAPDGTVTVTTPTTVSPGATVKATYSGFPTGVTQTIVWQLSTDGSTGWASISGATKTSYVIPAADLGKYLRAEVTSTKSSHTTAKDDSTAQLVVEPSELLALTVPSITGAGVVNDSAPAGTVLTASTGIWNVTGTTFTYQWYRNGGIIPGATSSTFTLPGDALGDNIGVVVKASASGFDSVSTTTNTVIVTTGAAPTATTATKIGGSAIVGQTLSATTGIWTLDTLSFSYQWFETPSGSQTSTAITDATSSTYLLQPSDAGSMVYVVVTATRVGYADGHSRSASTTAVTAPTSN